LFIITLSLHLRHCREKYVNDKLHSVLEEKTAPLYPFHKDLLVIPEYSSASSGNSLSLARDPFLNSMNGLSQTLNGTLSPPQLQPIPQLICFISAPLSLKPKVSSAQRRH
jgi:hypothetical protein